jgi:hypothetical protein
MDARRWNDRPSLAEPLTATTPAVLVVTIAGLIAFLTGCRQQIADRALPPAPPAPQRTYEGRAVGITDGDGDAAEKQSNVVQDSYHTGGTRD